MSVVFANVSTFVGDILVREGDAWATDDPFVKSHPDLFNDDPLRVHRSTPEVEQASAAPGEKRARRG